LRTGSEKWSALLLSRSQEQLRLFGPSAHRRRGWEDEAARKRCHALAKASATPPERLRGGGRRAGASSRGFPGLVTLRHKSGPFVTPVTLCGLFLFPAVSTAKQKQAGEERGKQRDGARQGTCRRECGRRRACAPKILGLSGALVSIFVGSGPRGAKGGKVVEAGLSIVWKRGSKRRRSGDHDQRRSLRHAGKAAERRALWRRGKKDS